MQRTLPPLLFLLVAQFLLSIHSLRAQENQTPANPTPAPIVVSGDTLSFPGHTIQLDQQGFPEQLLVTDPASRNRPPAGTDSGTSPIKLLAENIHFHFTRQSDGKDIRLVSEGLIFTVQRPDAVHWQASSSSEELQMDAQGSLTSGGSLSFSVNVTGLQDLELKDVTLHIPFNKEVTKYMTGLGVNGVRPDSMLVWDWTSARNHVAKAWIGDQHAGLQFELSSSPGDHGKGGITVGIKGKSMLVNDYSGPCTLPKGATLFYHFTLMITHKPPDSRTFIE